MAVVNKLVRDGTEISLDANTNGFALLENGYTPAVVEQNEDGTWPREVMEAVGLIVRGTDQDDIADNIRPLKNMLRRAGEYIRNITDSTPTWWHQKLTDESNERRALVRRGRTENRGSLYNWPTSPGDLVEYGLGLARGPFWESTSIITSAKSAAKNAGGDIWDYTTEDSVTIAGDANARVALLTVFGGTSIAEFWIGVRTDRLGDRTAFQPIWQCEDGTPGTDTSDTGTEMTCTFADQTMQERMTIDIDQAMIAAYQLEQRGQHLVLLRARNTGGSDSVRLYLKSGYTGSALWRSHDYATVASTDYKLYPVGTIQIPPQNLHEAQNNSFWRADADFGLAIEAEQTAGSGSLQMDRFAIVPQAEGWCHVSNASISSATIEQLAAHILTAPGDTQRVYSGANATTNKGPKLDVDPVLGLFLPPGAGSLIVAAQRSTIQDLTDAVYLRLKYYPRWTELRGSN